MSKEKRYTFVYETVAPDDREGHMSWTKMPGQIRDADGNFLSLLGTEMVERIMHALNDEPRP